MKALTHERLFEPFIDAVDGVVCVPAASTAADVARAAAPCELRFPLMLDRNLPLRDQVASSSHAPASSRFGPYCDNITGMNWEMPDGRRVRVGERVVKSTTGYDLLRFLLGSGDRYGRPTDYVLRLRPACETAGVFYLQGETAALRQAAAGLLQTSWLHWFESVDWIAENNLNSLLRLAVHCQNEEWLAYEEFLAQTAAQFHLTLQSDKTAGAIYDGCPDLVVKTSPEFVIPQTLHLAGQPGVRCVALGYCAVIHVFLPAANTLPEQIRQLIRPLEASLYDQGGDWRSRHTANCVPPPPETGWIKTLVKEWKLS